MEKQHGSCATDPCMKPGCPELEAWEGEGGAIAHEAEPVTVVDSRPRITEEWLKSVGFKWHQLHERDGKHWLLWIGEACSFEDELCSFEDIGLELSAGRQLGDFWFCWFRSDCAHRYSRFIHVRHIVYQDELVKMIEGITGQTWNPENNLYGSMRTPAHAARLRRERERVDIRWMETSSQKWRDIEKDDSRGGALPQHMQAAIDGGKAK